MEDEKKSDVVEEQVSEATEEIATPTPYKNPDRNLMDKEDEKTATEESQNESDETKSKEEHPVGVEDAVFKKRYDDLKRHYDETVSKHKDELIKLKKEKEAISKQPIFKTKEELENWRRDYPEMYDSVMQITSEAQLKTKQELQEEMLEVKRQQARLAREKAEVELAKTHPDYKEIRESKDFHEWASVQDKMVQSWLYDNIDNSIAAARAIDLYKYDRGLSTKKVSESAKREAAKSVSKTKVSETPSDKKIWKWDEIRKLKPSEYDKFEKEIDMANREGRIQ
jgi:hypothetical protein